MADYVVRLYSRSVIRLGTKPCDDEASRRSLFLGLSHAQIAVFDSLRDVADDVRVPDGLTIQVKLGALDINSAISLSIGVAGHTLSLLSCVSMASADAPIPIWAYDASEG